MTTKVFSKDAGTLFVTDELGIKEYYLKRGNVITPTLYSLCTVKDNEEVCEYLKVDIFLDKIMLLFPGIEIEMIHLAVEERVEFQVNGREWRWQYSVIQGEENTTRGWYYQMFIGDSEVCTFSSSSSSVSEFEGVFECRDGWGSKLQIMCGTLINVLLLLRRKF